MSVFDSRPALRWLVPAAAAALVIGGGAAIGRFAVAADPRLPERSAAQLLVDVRTARLDGLSGTVVQRADLGLPAIASLLGGPSGLGSLVSGSNTLRVWYSGPDQARVALTNTMGESDIVRNGRDVWLWQSRTNSGRHYRLPADGADRKPLADPTHLPASPREAAERALAAIEPSTEVTTGRNARVAGRDAYELVLTPRDRASLVGQVRMAIDAAEHLPLRVEVFARAEQEPAFEVAFTQISFERPGAERFRFNPPPGAKITEERDTDKAERGPEPRGADRSEPTVVGQGWTSVLVARVGDGADARPGGKATDGAADRDGEALLGALTRVSGPWGSGRLLSGKLFSALLTDDGRLLVGAVTPQRLYEVAPSPAARVK